MTYHVFVHVHLFISISIFALQVRELNEWRIEFGRAFLYPRRMHGVENGMEDQLEEGEQMNEPVVQWVYGGPVFSRKKMGKRKRPLVGQDTIKKESCAPKRPLVGQDTTIKKESCAPIKVEVDAKCHFVGESKPGGPFPSLLRPVAEEAYRVLSELISVHGELDIPKNNVKSIPVLDSLVRTILSQNTTDVTSARAFHQLKSRFPNYDEMEHATHSDIEAEIKCCGLAEKRALVIKAILQTLRSERNELSMEYLHQLGDEAVKKELCRFKGVGPKTAACVLMFCLNRPEFPVDTHVWRIAKRLHWVPPSATREQTYDHLNLRIPDEIKYAMHVLLVGHGKCCTACAKNNKPRRKPIDRCPLTISSATKSK